MDLLIFLTLFCQTIQAFSLNGFQRSSFALRSEEVAIASFRSSVTKSQEPPFEVTMEALIIYHAEHGDLVIPSNFVMPFNSPYPPMLQGLNLASLVYQMKWWRDNVSTSKERQQQLNDMGFIWGRLQTKWDLIVEALGAYKTWRKDTDYYPVMTTTECENEGESEGENEKNLKINNSNGSPIWIEVVDVAESFVVPQSPHFPVATWTLPLGYLVKMIRLHSWFISGPHKFERIQLLNSIGLVWDKSERKFGLLVWALREFKRLHRGVDVNNVAQTYIVPDNSAFPPQLWGYPLGVRLKNLRQKRTYLSGNFSESREKLIRQEGVETEFGGQKGAYAKLISRATNYRKIHGKPPPRTYVEEDGYCLGKLLYGAKNRITKKSEERTLQMRNLGLFNNGEEERIKIKNLKNLNR